MTNFGFFALVRFIDRVSFKSIFSSCSSNPIFPPPTNINSIRDTGAQPDERGQALRARSKSENNSGEVITTAIVYCSKSPNCFSFQVEECR
jgi:hypothetical protein